MRTATIRESGNLINVKHRMFNVLAGISLVSCLVSALLWIRSYRVRDAAPRDLAGSGLQIISSHGRLVAVRGRLIRSNTPSTVRSIIVRNFIAYAHVGEQLLNAPALSNGYGFGYASTEGGHSVNGKITDGYRFELLAVPYWVVMLVLALLPAFAIKRIHGAHRPGTLHCPTCGYDLRATPERCPECGAMAKETPITKVTV